MLLTLSSALSAHVLRIDDHVHVYTASASWNGTLIVSCSPSQKNQYDGDETSLLTWYLSACVAGTAPFQVRECVGHIGRFFHG